MRAPERLARRLGAAITQIGSPSGEAEAPGKLALVLSGGATRGAFQVGVIDVLNRQGIQPDLLIGTSVGAINAAYWAFHPGEDLGVRLLGVWHEAAEGRILPDQALRIVGSVIASRLHERNSLARILRRELPHPEASIEEATLPLQVVACNLGTGRVHVFSRGPALPALLASAAVPGVFPPVMIEGEPYADGGLVANCPLQVAHASGATDVIAVDLIGGIAPWTHAGVLDTVERAVNVSLAKQTDAELASLPSGLRVAVLRPRLDPAPGFGDFSQTLSLYRSGRDAAELFLAEHWSRDGRVLGGEMEFRAAAGATTSRVPKRGPLVLGMLLPRMPKHHARLTPSESVHS